MGQVNLSQSSGNHVLNDQHVHNQSQTETDSQVREAKGTDTMKVEMPPYPFPVTHLSVGPTKDSAFLASMA